MSSNWIVEAGRFLAPVVPQGDLSESDPDSLSDVSSIGDENDMFENRVFVFERLFKTKSDDVNRAVLRSVLLAFVTHLSPKVTWQKIFALKAVGLCQSHF